MLAKVEDNFVIERLRFENPWWSTNEIEENYQRLKCRPFITKFNSLVEESEIKRAVILMGPRRVGKTVMLYQTIRNLLNKGIPKTKICFINIENPLYNNFNLDHLFTLARKAVFDDSTKGWYVFIDEIQYLKDWERQLKILVDTYPETKFIVSGSAAAALKAKSNESGAGRFTEFLLPPLTFKEYIYLKEYNGLVVPAEIEWQGISTCFYNSFDIHQLNKHFIDYINFGGYPEVIFSDKIKNDPKRYIKNDIIDKVLLRDLPGIYGIQNVQDLNSFFTMLAYNSGNELSLDNLSKASGVEKHQIKKYLDYLEAAFLIKTVHRVDDTSKKFLRATRFKVYLTNPSLRSALFAPLQPNDDMLGNLVETAIFSQLMHNDSFTPLYARWSNGRVQGEVDMVGLDSATLKPDWCAEIKWSNRFYDNPEDVKSLFYFCSQNNLNSALVTTINKSGTKTLGNISITFAPAALVAYSLGEINLS